MRLLIELLQGSFRSLRWRLGFTFASTLTLAMGITASCLVFTLVEGVLLRSLPFPQADSIVQVWQTDPGLGIEQGPVSPANFMDWRERADVFQTLAMVQPFGFDYAEGEEPREFSASLVSEGFFQTFEMPALLGRNLEPSDYQADAPPVVVMSEDLWRREFGADSEWVGRELILDGVSRTLVGISPSTFQFPPGEEFWAPRVLGEGDRRLRRRTFLRVVGRLRQAVPLETGRGQMEAIGAQLEREYPAANTGVRVHLLPLYEATVAGTRPALLVFLGSVGFLLLIACANVGALQLNQGIQRLRELSIRSALGASRRRLVSLLLVEGLTIAVLASLLGLLLTRVGLSLLLQILPEELPRQSEISLNPTIFLFAGALALFSTLFFSVSPAVFLTQLDLFQSIRGGQTSTGGIPQSRLQSVLVTVQLAVSLVLLIGGGLLFRSYLALEWTDPGFRVSNLVTLQVFPNMEDVRRAAFYQDVLREFEQVPGVVGAAGVLSLPLGGEQAIELTPMFQIRGRPGPGVGNDPVLTLSVATPNYFGVMGIPLLQGRSLSVRDDAQAPLVGLINQAMADQFWSGEGPVGSRLQVDYGDGFEVEVVGVVGNVRHTRVGVADGPRLYLPYAQGLDWSITFVARTSGPPEDLIAVLKSKVWEAGYLRPIDRVATLDWLFAESIREARFRAWVIGLFSLLALLVVSVGLYSTISFGVAQRRREVGIRQALGASPSAIFLQIIQKSLRQLIPGGMLGLLAAFLLSPVLGGFLYEVGPRDLAVLLVCLTIVFLVALSAALLPARRASRVDPLLAMRID